MTKTTVYCKTRFTGFHQWPDAPESVKFLRNPHRHEFHVKVRVRVDHDDRAIEFITMKGDVDEVIQTDIHTELELAPAMSCEMLAKAIEKALVAHYPKIYKGVIEDIEVSEDGENGAIVSFNQ